jgi:glucose 1-dehydrogenase
MDDSFKDKRVFVTGAACGIGYEICRQFARSGAIVGLNSLRPERAEQAAMKLNIDIGEERVSAWAGNISDVNLIQSSIAEFSNQNGGLDVFVANAGITIMEPFKKINVENFDKITGVNMRGTFFSVQAAAKEMIDNGIKGRIILMSSVCGVQSHRNTSAYAMTKAAIIQLGKCLAEELGEHSITVNVVAPGATLCERTMEDPDYASGWSSVTPGQTVGTPEDVAHTTLFLANDRSSHITGETIMVDGGWTVTSPLPEHIKKDLNP